MTTKTNEEWIKQIVEDVLLFEGTAYEISQKNVQKSERDRLREIALSDLKSDIELVIFSILTQKDKETALAVEKERERIREEIGNALWNKDGSLKSHDVSYIVSTIMHKTMSPHSDT